jgi:hypothetical protein
LFNFFDTCFACRLHSLCCYDYVPIVIHHCSWYSMNSSKSTFDIVHLSKCAVHVSQHFLLVFVVINTLSLSVRVNQNGVRHLARAENSWFEGPLLARIETSVRCRRDLIFVDISL